VTDTPDDGTVDLEQASRLLNVPAPTIRSWERRYHLFAVGSRAEGERRYSPDAIRVLRLLRGYLTRGHGSVAAAIVAEAGATADPPQVRLVSALLLAAYHLQPNDIHFLLATATEALGLDRTIDEVLLPALREIGQQWAAGSFDVAQEHAASAAAQAWLAEVNRGAPAPARPQTIVLACGPRDLHTIALESLGVLLSRRGWDCLLLGARTPTASLGRTVRDVAPAGVVVVSHLLRARSAAIRSLRSVAVHRVPLFLAGSAFDSRSARSGVPGTYLGENVAEAADLITATLTPAAA